MLFFYVQSAWIIRMRQILEDPMPLDGVTAKCLAVELNEQLADARVDRIVQPDRFDVILQLRCDSSNYRLILSANPSAPRVHLTTESRENPSIPPMFCMLLRKHLLGARLLGVSTPGYERIFELRFDTINEIGDHQEKKLVVEIMGRHSNIILLNSDGRIHDAILHVDAAISRVREIMPARLYVLPPGQSKLAPETALARLDPAGPDDLAAIVQLLAPAGLLLPLDKALLETLQGFSPQLCREVLLRADLTGREKTAELTIGQAVRLRTALAGLLQTIQSGRCSPTLFSDAGPVSLPCDFHALHLQIYPFARQTASLSEAMNLYFLERSRQNDFSQKKQSLAKIVGGRLEHARKKLAVHESDRQSGAAFEEYRRMGDLILANLPAIQPEQTQFLAVDYVQPGQPSVVVALEANLNASQNAQRYFRLYSKAKIRFTTASRLAAEDSREIAYLESLANALEAAGDMLDLQALRQEILAEGLPGSESAAGGAGGAGGAAAPEQGQQPGKSGSRKRDRQKAAAARSQAGSGKKGTAGRQKKAKGPASPAPLAPRRYLSSDGMTILVGRNNLQNDQLTLKTAQKTDLWLHIQHSPGTHVIVQTNRQPVPDHTLEEAAGIAAWFSRAAIAQPGERSHTNSPGSGGKGGSGGSGRANTATAVAGLKVAVDYCPVSHVRKPAAARPGMVIYEHYQTIMVSPLDPQALTAL
jgi:predicted ribosome quality control (RQC) complex YloA/Tae2 family protein